MVLSFDLNQLKGCIYSQNSATLAAVDTSTSIAPAKLMMKSTSGKSYALRDWLTSFPFLLVAIDPYTAESSWILDTATRIFDHYSPADVRVGWICAADEQGCKKFLGPLAENYLTFPDPDREIISQLKLETLPALVHVRSDGFLQVANGWNPKAWSSVCDWISTILAWSNTIVPVPSDPNRYTGTPAEGI